MFNIIYTYNGDVRKYCVADMDYAKAEEMLSLWMGKYWDEAEDRGKAYPNGKGFYPVTKAYIAEV